MRVGSLVTRLTLLQQVTLLVVILVFAGCSLLLASHAIRAQQTRLLDEVATRVAVSYDAELKEERDPARAARGLIDESVMPGIDLRIVSASGRLLADSRVISMAREGLLRASARSANGAVVEASCSDALYRAWMSSLVRSLAISALILLLASAFLSRWVARRALVPLSAMASRARRVSLEQGTRSMGERTGLAELDRLAEAYDTLLVRVDDALLAERRLTADASHELRTPLTVLSGELELAASKAEPGSAVAMSLAKASDQVSLMRDLVEAVLLLHRSGDLPRLRQDGFDPVNLSDLAREGAAEALERRPDRAGDLTVRAPDEVLVPGDLLLLTSAFRNLLENALKFTRPGDPVRVQVEEDAGVAHLVVEDGGAGIPPGDHERIFDPFFRGVEARAGHAGFGLGLPIMNRIVRASGGEVALDSSPLGGARFTVRFPGWKVE